MNYKKCQIICKNHTYKLEGAFGWEVNGTDLRIFEGTREKGPVIGVFPYENLECIILGDEIIKVEK